LNSCFVEQQVLTPFEMFIRKMMYFIHHQVVIIFAGIMGLVSLIILAHLTIREGLLSHAFIYSHKSLLVGVFMGLSLLFSLIALTGLFLMIYAFRGRAWRLVGLLILLGIVIIFNIILFIIIVPMFGIAPATPVEAVVREAVMEALPLEVVANMGGIRLRGFSGKLCYYLIDYGFKFIVVEVAQLYLREAFPIPTIFSYYLVHWGLWGRYLGCNLPRGAAPCPECFVLAPSCLDFSGEAGDSASAGAAGKVIIIVAGLLPLILLLVIITRQG
jgi:hypothetical protein